MRLSGSLRSMVACAGALALTVWAPRAGASGFQLVEENGSGLGNAHSGQAAAAEDASTIYWNPAGMTFLSGRQLVAAGTLVRPITKFRNEGSTPPPLITNVGGNGGDSGGVNVVPSGYFSWEVAPERIWVGLGVSAPFGLVTEWDPDWVGRFHGTRSEVKTININPSAAVEVTEWLSIGAGINAQWLDAELSNAVDYSAIAFAAGGAPALGVLAATCAGATTSGPAAGTNCEGLATVKADSWSWGWNVGIMLTSVPTRTRLGLSYRSAVEHDLGGTVRFANRPALLDAGVPDGDVKAKIKLPDTFSAAVSQHLGSRLQLLADFTFTHWRVLQDLSIFRADGRGLTQTPLEFKNTFRVGIGANYQLSDPLKLRVGVAYDESPVGDEHRTPRLPDQDRLWVATGVQWAFSQAAAVDLGFAWLFVKEGSSNLSQPPPFNGQPQAPRGTLAGRYVDTNVWILGAQAKYSF